MPLTDLRRQVLQVLATNRNERSHFAGGLLLRAAEDSARFSHDFDIFHEANEEVAKASDFDVESLRKAGYEVGKPGWIGDDPSLTIHLPSIYGCWPTVTPLPS